MRTSAARPAELSPARRLASSPLSLRSAWRRETSSAASSPGSTGFGRAHEAPLYPARTLRAPVVRKRVALGFASRALALAWHVVDHQRDALKAIGVAQAVLEVEGPVAVDQPAVVDLDREARRAPPNLRRVVDAQALAVPSGAAALSATTSETNRLSSGVGIRSAARWASLIASRSTVTDHRGR